MGIFARKKEAKTEFETAVKILITECEGQGPRYIALQVPEKDKNATIYNRIKSTEDRKMILETMIFYRFN